MSQAVVACTKCGAALEISATAFSVACSACGQWHLVDRSGPTPVATPYEDAAPAEPSPGPETSPASPPMPEAEPVAVEAIDEEIRRLDEQWDHDRQQHLVFGFLGNLTEPNLASALILGGFVVGIGVSVLYDAGGLHPVGAAIVMLGMALGGFRVRKALAYQEALARYQRRRRATSKPTEARAE